MTSTLICLVPLFRLLVSRMVFVASRMVLFFLFQFIRVNTLFKVKILSRLTRGKTYISRSDEKTLSDYFIINQINKITTKNINQV